MIHWFNARTERTDAANLQHGHPRKQAERRRSHPGRQSAVPVLTCLLLTARSVLRRRHACPAAVPQLHLTSSI